MKKRTIVVLLAVVGVAYLAIMKKQAETSVGIVSKTPDVTPAATVSETPVAEPVAQVVEEILHQHEGEDSPVVHAFEEALEEKAKHEA